MPRKVKFVPTPSRLSQILEHLRKEPRPQLQKVKALKITYAYRNDHWGARCVLIYSEAALLDVQRLVPQTFCQG